MKILHVTPDLNFASNFVKPVCIQQVKMGNYVNVISTSAFYLTDNEAEKFAENFCEGNANLTLTILNLRLRKFEWSLIVSYRRYIKLLKQEKYDVIVFHTTVDTTFPLIFASIFSNSKSVYFNHGVPALGYSGVIKATLNVTEKINIKLSDKVFTIGEGMGRALKEIDAQVNPIIIKPGSACGVRLLTKDFSMLRQLRAKARAELGFSENDKIIIYVGRPVKRKGVFDLIEAWKLIERNKHYHLLLIGPEKEDFNYSEFEHYNIKARGYITDVANYYLCADILCVPSYHEGLGYTYLEASSFGCVPVSSDIIGPTDFVISGVNGITVPPGNIELISKSLSTLLLDDIERQRLAKNAFVTVLQFDQEIVSARIAQALLNWP